MLIPKPVILAIKFSKHDHSAVKEFVKSGSKHLEEQLIDK